MHPPLAQGGQNTVVGRLGGQLQVVRREEVANRAFENFGLLLPMHQLFRQLGQLLFGGSQPVFEARNFLPGGRCCFAGFGVLLP